MKLDTWENYVKNNKLEPYYNAKAGSYLVATLKTKCNEAYEYIMDEVEGKSEDGHRKNLEKMIDDDGDSVIQNAKYLATSVLNTYIKEALEIIEEFEESQVDEQCCIELSKYEAATNE